MSGRAYARHARSRSRYAALTPKHVARRGALPCNLLPAVVTEYFVRQTRRSMRRDATPPQRPSLSQAARRRRQRRTSPPEVLLNDQVLTLMSASPVHGTGLRNRTLLAILSRSGSRRSEALELRPKDIDATMGRRAPFSTRLSQARSLHTTFSDC